MRRIIYSRQAAKSLQRMDGATSKRIRNKIRLLADDPEALANNVRKLKGAENLMRLRIGDWRVIYTDDGIILSIQRIAPRGSAYE
ncbi:MAG: type II toxin-antitoxin system RelE/ParE family toxin [Sphingorhabdus sp.]